MSRTRWLLFVVLLSLLLASPSAFRPSRVSAEGLALRWPADLSGALIALPPDATLRLPPTLRLVEHGYVGHIPVARVEQVGTRAESADIHIDLSLAEGRARATPAALNELTAVERVLLSSGTLLNPEQALLWRQPPQQAWVVQRPTAGAALLGHLEVREAGWYRLSGATLLAAGIPLEQVDAARLRLTQGGEEMALRLSRPTGRLGAEDRIEFYVEPQRDRFRDSDTLQLWLLPEGEVGERIGSVALPVPAAQPLVERQQATTHLNPQGLYESRYPGSGGDYWFWQDLRALAFPPRPDAQLPLTLPGALNTMPGAITLSFQGISAGDHALAVLLNGHLLGEVHWRGIAPQQASLSIPAGMLEPGANEVRLRSALPEGVVDGTYLDETTIRYASALQAQGGALTFEGAAAAARYEVSEVTGGEAILLDVTDPAHPVWLTGAQSTPRYDLYLPLTAGGTVAQVASSGAQQLPALGTVRFADARPGPHRYHVASPLSVHQPVHVARAQPAIEPGAGADLILIAPAPFHGALAPLVERRSAQGLRVRLVDLQAVYEGWGHGRPGPIAIRAFLAEAFAHWPAPAPSYVLLVGDGSYNPLGDKFDRIPYPLPAFLAHVDPWMGETASDHQYTLVSGDDRLPDLMLGRIPARSADEVAAVVEKTIAYEQLSGEWLNRAIAVADDDSPTLAQFGAMSAAGTIFATSAEAAITRLPTEMERHRFYYAPQGASGAYSDPAQMRAALHQALAESGQFVLFFGHSSYHQWAAEIFLHLNDLPTIPNEQRYPIVLNMTCFTGAFHLVPQTLDERWLLERGRGAVATWSASGLGLATGHDTLVDAFLSARFAPQRPAQTVGEAMLAGKLALAARGRHLDLLDTYHLLGDPTLRWAPLP